MAITSLTPWRRGDKKIQVRRDITDPFYEFQERMNNMFDRFFNEFSLAPFGAWGNGGDFQPRVDIGETDTEIKVSAELPGLDENDIEVSLIMPLIFCKSGLTPEGKARIYRKIDAQSSR